MVAVLSRIAGEAGEALPGSRRYVVELDLHFDRRGAVTEVRPRKLGSNERINQELIRAAQRSQFAPPLLSTSEPTMAETSVHG